MSEFQRNKLKEEREEEAKHSNSKTAHYAKLGSAFAVRDGTSMSPLARRPGHSAK
jgi:hypothetical protein